MSKPALSLADLQEFDPHGGTGDINQRWLCPLCGIEKPRDATHRCLIVHAPTGAWNCKRCGATGKLREHWQSTSRQDRARAEARRIFAIQPDKPTQSTLEWKQHLRGLVPVAATPGAKYFESRGISVELAHAAGARFSPTWSGGRPAVVFPIRDAQSTLVAAQGRFIDGRDNPKAITYGPKKEGAFLTPGALDRKEGAALIVTEAPIDALSLAAVGFPAIALCGTSGPMWLHRVGAFRRVLLAFDADEAGDRAALDLSSELAAFGARCQRLRPEDGKDWNEILCSSGKEALSDWLALKVLLDE